MENLAKALVNLRKTLQNPKKSSKGYNWKYADLAEIHKSINSPLIENGLTITQQPLSTMHEGNFLVGVKTILLHESGEQLENEFLTPCKDFDPKTIGGFITYYRRYATLSVLDLAPDDDGEVNPEKNDFRGKPLSEKQLKLLRANHDKLTEQEVSALKSGTMNPADASAIIGEILNGKR